MEIWKIIPTVPQYQASDRGRIRRSAPARGARVGHITAMNPLPAGYLLVTLNMSGKVAARLVHRLVAEAFLGPAPSDKPDVHHKNGKKDDNRLDNLEYVTRSVNLRHAMADTGAYRGVKNSAAVLTEEMVREIRELHGAGLGYKRLARRFGVKWGSIRDLIKGRTWGWLQ